MSNETEKSLRDELSDSLNAVQERLRDEHGRFAKQTDAPAEEVKPEEAHDDVVDTAPANDAAPAPNPGVVPAAPKPDDDPFPSSWKKEHQKHWSTLPPELKKYIREHEEQTRQAMTRQDEDRLTGKTLREIISPYMPLLQADGLNLQQAIQGMLQQNYVLRQGTPEQKRQLVLNACKMYGIDLSQPNEQPTGWIDPQVAALQQQLAEVRNFQQQQLAAQQYQERASIDSQIAAFASAPGHEHFQRVAPRMGALMASNQAQDLEDAYQQAIWADPELRSTLLAAQQAEAEAKRAAEAKAKATAARNASGSVRGSSSGIGNVPPAPKGTLREELRAALAAAKDR
jgi:hypothetical protein